MRPPEMSGTNYEFWKACIKVYIQAQGARVQRSVVTRWNLTTITVLNNTTGLKDEAEWTKQEHTSTKMIIKVGQFASVV